MVPNPSGKDHNYFFTFRIFSFVCVCTSAPEKQIMTQEVKLIKLQPTKRRFGCVGVSGVWYTKIFLCKHWYASPEFLIIMK